MEGWRCCVGTGGRPQTPHPSFTPDCCAPAALRAALMLKVKCKALQSALRNASCFSGTLPPAGSPFQTADLVSASEQKSAKRNHTHGGDGFKFSSRVPFPYCITAVRFWLRTTLPRVVGAKESSYRALLLKAKVQS